MLPTSEMPNFDNLREPSKAVVEELCNLTFHLVVIHITGHIVYISNSYCHSNCIQVSVFNCQGRWTWSEIQIIDA